MYRVMCGCFFYALKLETINKKRSGKIKISRYCVESLCKQEGNHKVDISWCLRILRFFVGDWQGTYTHQQTARPRDSLSIILTTKHTTNPSIKTKTRYSSPHTRYSNNCQSSRELVKRRVPPFLLTAPIQSESHNYNCYSCFAQPA